MGITIISAVYGTTNAGLDVTAECQGIVSSGNDDITANNATFTDPDVGVEKSFAILYTNPALNNGNPIALGCQENGTLDLVPTPPTATTPVATPGTPVFTIVNAMYGTANNGFNVTAVCQWLVNNGGNVIPVNNNSFGDPDVGNAKSFAIVYTAAGGVGPRSLACPEGTMLTLT